MEIHATQHLKVQISDQEQKRIVLEYFYSKFKWKKDYFIKNGQVMEDVEYSTSHRWTDEEFVREAQEDDYFVAGIIKLINKLP